MRTVVLLALLFTLTISGTAAAQSALEGSWVIDPDATLALTGAYLKALNPSLTDTQVREAIASNDTRIVIAGKKLTCYLAPDKPDEYTIVGVWEDSQCTFVKTTRPYNGPDPVIEEVATVWIFQPNGARLHWIKVVGSTISHLALKKQR